MVSVKHLEELRFALAMERNHGACFPAPNAQ